VPERPLRRRRYAQDQAEGKKEKEPSTVALATTSTSSHWPARERERVRELTWNRNAVGGNTRAPLKCREAKKGGEKKKGANQASFLSSNATLGRGGRRGVGLATKKKNMIICRLP